MKFAILWTLLFFSSFKASSMERATILKVSKNKKFILIDHGSNNKIIPGKRAKLLTNTEDKRFKITPIFSGKCIKTYKDSSLWKTQAHNKKFLKANRTFYFYYEGDEKLVGRELPKEYQVKVLPEIRTNQLLRRENRYEIFYEEEPYPLKVRKFYHPAQWSPSELGPGRLAISKLESSPITDVLAKADFEQQFSHYLENFVKTDQTHKTDELIYKDSLILTLEDESKQAQVLSAKERQDFIDHIERRGDGWADDMDDQELEDYIRKYRP